MSLDLQIPAATTYTSQQQAFINSMITYLQDPNNWPGGNVLITDFRDGSITYTLLAAIATGLDMVGLQVFNAGQQASVLTATGTNLDNEAADWGVVRKAAVAANGGFTFLKNTAATVAITIPAGSLVSTLPDDTGTVVTYTTDADATLAVGDTTINVNATCSDPGPGIGGNISATTPVVIASAVPGIDGVEVTADITNGLDQEDDDSLRNRVIEAIDNPQGGGTPTDYHEWATGVTGVGSATVLPKNRGNGTVDVVITGTNQSVPSAALITSVQDAINANLPIDVDCQVIAPTTETIDVTTSITPDSGYTVASLTTAVQNAVTSYMNSVAIGGTVYGSQLQAAILKVQGVIDAQVQLSVSGTTETNVPLAATQVAVTGQNNVQAIA